MTGEDLRKTAFSPTRAFSKGYDVAEVHAFVESAAVLVDQLHERYAAQIERLRNTIARASDQSEQGRSIRILTAADQTARSVVLQAEEHAKQLESEAAAAHADSSQKSKALLREAVEYSEMAIAKADERAAVIMKEADDRAKAMRQEAEARLLELHEAANRAQTELISETSALLTLRESARLQMQGFLADLLATVSSAQDPAGVDASGDMHVSTLVNQPSVPELKPSGRGITRELLATRPRQSKTASWRSRRPARVAGQSDKRFLPVQRSGH